MQSFAVLSQSQSSFMAGFLRTGRTDKDQSWTGPQELMRTGSDQSCII